MIPTPGFYLATKKHTDVSRLVSKLTNMHVCKWKTRLPKLKKPTVGLAQTCKQYPTASTSHQS
jgi:hypothetical protein